MLARFLMPTATSPPLHAFSIITSLILFSPSWSSSLLSLPVPSPLHTCSLFESRQMSVIGAHFFRRNGFLRTILPYGSSSWSLGLRRSPASGSLRPSHLAYLASLAALLAPTWAYYWLLNASCPSASLGVWSRSQKRANCGCWPSPCQRSL